MRLNIKLINCNYSHDLYWPRILARPVVEAWRRRRVAKEFLFLLWIWFLVFGSSTISRKSERINYTKFDYDCCTKQAVLHVLNVLLIFLAFSHLPPACHPAFCWVSCTRGTSVLFSQLQVRVELRLLLVCASITDPSIKSKSNQNNNNNNSNKSNGKTHSCKANKQIMPSRKETKQKGSTTIDEDGDGDGDTSRSDKKIVKNKNNNKYTHMCVCV